MDKINNRQETIQLINDKISEVMSVEGSVKRFFKAGNSIIIQFDNGKLYKQPLVSLSIADACLDETESVYNKSEVIELLKKHAQYISNTKCILTPKEYLFNNPMKDRIYELSNEFIENISK
jgi:hypothetical protein